MELQEKANVSVFTDVDKEIFLRDIYPEVTNISSCIYHDVIFNGWYLKYIKILEWPVCWACYIDSPAQTSSSKRCGSGTMSGEVDSGISYTKGRRQESQDPCVYGAADGLPSQKLYIQVSLDNCTCCGIICLI